MTAKLRIRTKGIEIEWEGEVEFLKSELPGLVGAIIEAIGDSGLIDDATEVDRPTSGNGQATFTATSLAAKVQPKTGPDLFKVALAKLQLSDNFQEATHLQILEEMKSAKQFYKQAMQRNLKPTIDSLLKKREINEPSTGKYTLSHETLEQFRARA
ncbi:MAG TPA: hypothetical protein VIF88_05685 [Methylocystis sp.]|jgi:hypothetical protein